MMSASRKISAPELENSFEKLDYYPPVTERYYHSFYFVHKKGPENEHHCVLLHSNKICLITLAPSHPIVRNKKTVVGLDFQVSDKIDRLENKVKGKGKRGAQQVMSDSVLCYVNCEDGSKYSIWGCIKGKLLEINQSLLKNPNLMRDKPSSDGFIAIVLPCLKKLEIEKKNLMSHDLYMSMLKTQDSV